MKYYKEKNYFEALKYFNISASMGHPVAMNNIGVCYHHGLGINQSLEIAKQWYEKSEAHGYEKATINKKEIISTLESGVDECIIS